MFGSLDRAIEPRGPHLNVGVRQRVCKLSQLLGERLSPRGELRVTAQASKDIVVGLSVSGQIYSPGTNEKER